MSKRIEITVTPEVELLIEDAKKIFRDKPRAEVLRMLIMAGIASSKNMKGHLA